MYKNLYKETINILESFNKTLDDVIWIGGEDFEITKENFIELAMKTNYDSGYGSVEIANDLVIVGEDWWLERKEYDGAEWWEYKTLPIKPNILNKVKHLIIEEYGNLSLKEINQEGEE